MIWEAGSTASGAHFVAGWREDNFSLRYTLNIPKQDVWKAHAWAKKELIQ
jgi:starch phosphorylase